MNILNRIFRPEVRSHEADSSAPLTDGWFSRIMGTFGGTASGEVVNEQSAMSVPAQLAAVAFLSGEIASLPLHVYQKKNGGAQKVGGGLSDLLAYAANDETTSFGWRQYMLSRVFTGGRSFTYIERSPTGYPVNLFSLTPSGVEVKLGADLRKTYHYTAPGTSRKVVYDAADIIDIPFLLKEDQLTHLSPILANKEALGLAIAATKYGAKVFQNGGIPPLVLQGAFASMETAERASNDLHAAMAKAYKQGRQAIALPVGFEAKQLGFNPSEMQLVELQRWCVEQIARVYSLPPTFLQDLTNGTHSNTEQQDLHYVKHTLTRWLRQIEQELNLKLIGRGKKSRYIKFSVDGLLRGDYKTRMEGNAKAIATGQLTPNEARAMEDREELEGGSVGYIQGANMPLKTQQNATATSQAKVDKGDGGASDD